MKFNYLLGLFVLLFLFGSCDLEEVAEVCDETPSTEFLLSIRNVDYDEVGSNFLHNPYHNVDVCNEHFSAPSLAGQQYGQAVTEINRQIGTEMHFTTTRSGIVHKNSFELIPSSPTSSIFDYIDVNTDMPNACSLPDDLTFAMRTCRHDQTGGGTNHFTIMAKSTNYGHFTDPSSSDFPMKHGILHELAHAFGMSHTPNWAEADKDYISTMQGNLEYLSALDVDYLRHKYPEAMADHRNYVASSLTRFDGVKGKFEDQNPSDFYINADGDVLDCSTDAAPEFFVAWFNTGNLDGEDESCAANRIFLREKSVDATEIDIKTWNFATMPFLSQDQWKGQASASVEDPTAINYARNWELVFKVNAWGTQDEITDEDNEITMDVSLYDSASCN